jgi:hypothetical protein
MHAELVDLRDLREMSAGPEGESGGGGCGGDCDGYECGAVCWHGNGCWGTQCGGDLRQLVRRAGMWYRLHGKWLHLLTLRRPWTAA